MIFGMIFFGQDFFCAAEFFKSVLLKVGPSAQVFAPIRIGLVLLYLRML